MLNVRCRQFVPAPSKNLEEDRVPRDLVDLLWRDHPDAPTGGRRGPRARLSSGAVAETAVRLADAEGLDAVTVRRLATELGTSTMSVYTHVNSRDDLLVLMVDAVRLADEGGLRGADGVDNWEQAVRAVAADELALLLAHPWLLDVTDERVALGPGTIAAYDRQLAAVVPLGLDDVRTDAALTHLLDFVRANARSRRPGPRAGELAEHWPAWGARLGAYLGEAHPLAQRVGAAAGEANQGAYSADAAWAFGLDRVVASFRELAPR